MEPWILESLMLQLAFPAAFSKANPIGRETIQAGSGGIILTVVEQSEKSTNTEITWWVQSIWLHIGCYRQPNDFIPP